MFSPSAPPGAKPVACAPDRSAGTTRPASTTATALTRTAAPRNATLGERRDITATGLLKMRATGCICPLLGSPRSSDGTSGAARETREYDDTNQVATASRREQPR